ncbi:uncharacterized protein LOC120072673 isoform X2 [Benincasa hispida]|uniref:uncharacterized protein LOC120072673 isoform X2 n=1 Tax=Benincasa hispida TaxID=102211 RepID=UPI001902B684|nr:uncharacterized protein LOC120072673 isoform X2 [Benincasa hispida]
MFDDEIDFEVLEGVELLSNKFETDLSNVLISRDWSHCLAKLMMFGRFDRLDYFVVVLKWRSNQAALWVIIPLEAGYGQKRMNEILSLE